MSKLVSMDDVFKAAYTVSRSARVVFSFQEIFQGKHIQHGPTRPAGSPISYCDRPHDLADLIALAKMRDDSVSEAEDIMAGWADSFGLTKSQAIDLLWDDPEWRDIYLERYED